MDKATMKAISSTYTASESVLKQALGQAQKNELPFSCSVLKTEYKCDSQLMFPNHDNVFAWFESLYTKKLYPVEFSEKALKQFEMKGRSPPEFPSTKIAIIVVAPSSTHVHIGVSVPKNFVLQGTDKSDSLKDLMELPCDKIMFSPGAENPHFSYFTASLESETPFKQCDEVLRNMFDLLKKTGIYVVDDDDDDECYGMDEFDE